MDTATLQEGKPDGTPQDFNSSSPHSAHARNRDVEAAPPVSDSVEEWFNFIHSDFAQSNAHQLAGAAKLIQAKKSLKKRGKSFLELLGLLGLDEDKAERLMRISRHLAPLDSAILRNLPAAWTTVAILTGLKPEVLLACIADGRVHPRLRGEDAQRLVRQIRLSNSSASNGRAKGTAADTPATETTETITNAPLAAEAATNGTETSESAVTADVDKTLPAETLTKAADIGANSQGEIERKLARLEELERETARQQRQIELDEQEITELRGKLGTNIDIPHQRRLFHRALNDLQKSEAPNILANEKRYLTNSATCDLIELIRSAVRDGLKLDRFDLMYRPELH